MIINVYDVRAIALLGPCAHRIWKIIASQRGGRCRRLVFVLLARSAQGGCLYCFSGALTALYIYGVPSCLLALVWHTLAFILVLYVCVVRLVGCSFFRGKLLVKHLQRLFSVHLHHQEPYEPESKTLPTIFGHYVQPLSGGFKTSHNAIHKAEILQYSA